MLERYKKRWKEFEIKTLRVEVADYIKSIILGGNMEPGDKINEAELAKELKISRGPIREALRQLEQEGLVTYVPNKGCSVANLNVEDMYEMYLLRAELENIAVEVCEGRYDETSLARMEEAIRDMEAAALEESLNGLVTADQKFHEEILKAAKLPRLEKIWHSLDGANVSSFFTLRSLKMINWKTLGRNHHLLLDAARNMDKEQMKKEIRIHYLSVPEYIREYS